MKQCALLLSFSLSMIISSSLIGQPKWVNYATDGLNYRIAFQEDNVWCTFRGGLAFIDISTNETQIYNTANSDIPDNYIKDSKIAPDGTLWLLSGRTLGKFIDGTFIPINNLYEGIYPLLFLGKIEFDNEGNIIIIAEYTDSANNTEHAYFKIDHDEQITLFADAGMLDNTISNNYVVDHENRLWATFNGKVYMLDNGVLTTFDTTNAPLLTETFSMISVAPSGEVMITYLAQNEAYYADSILISIYDGQGWEAVSTTDIPNSDVYLLSLFNVFYDKEGDFWISTGDGDVFEYSDGTITTHPWPSNAPVPTEDWMSKILLDIDDDDNWWTYEYDFHENRIYYYHSGDVTSFSVSSGDFSSNSLEDIYIDKSGKTWVSSSRGISEFDGLDWINHTKEMYRPRMFLHKMQEDSAGNIWASLNHDSGEEYSFVKFNGEDWEHIYVGEHPVYFQSIVTEEFFFDHQNVLWAASNNGIIKYDGEEWIFFNELNSIIDNYIRVLAPKEDGTFFSANFDEIYYYNGTDFEQLFPPIPTTDQIYWLYVDSFDNLWIHSTNQMIIYDGTNYMDVSSNYPQQLFGKTIGMVQDIQGTYWFATCEGLLRYDEETWELQTEGVSKNCIMSVTVDSLNNIWMTTSSQGIAIYNKNGINTLAPPIRACMEGNTFMDVNGSGIPDAGDYPLSNQKIQLLPDSTIKFTSLLGTYRFQVPDNTEKSVVILPDNDNWELATDPSSYTVILEESCIDSLDFGLNSLQNGLTGEVHFAPGTPRCFLTTPAWLTIKNTGYLPIDGNCSLTIDEDVSLISAQPSPSDSSGNTYHWDFTALGPLQWQTIQLELQYPGVEAIGDIVQHNAVLVDYESNVLDTFLSQQEILCSYDPNDKTAYATGPSVENYSLLEDALEYLIRFENQGNDTAFQVVIRDTISPWLDINTFELISASHPVEVTIRGRMIEFTFSSISLPFTNIDPIGSHGFVHFQISPISTIHDNQLIENTAYIYFDFNPPIVTNTTQNILVEELPVISTTQSWDNQKRQCNFFFAPNPIEVSSCIHLPPAFEGGQFELYNTLGQRITVQTNLPEHFIFKRKQLPAGLYFYLFSNEKQACSGTLILK